VATDLNPLLAYLAGVLTILSPCVLPLVPIVLTGAQSKGRWGPVALGLGLTLSFTAVGLFVALIGFSIGLDGEVFRVVGGVIMLGIGLVLVSPRAQVWLAAAGGPVMGLAQGGMQRFETGGVAAQAGLGVLLGLVWAPCVGPTLGAASILAAQGQSLGAVSATMLIFGLGAATPLVLIGLASRHTLARLRDRMRSAGSRGKMILGGVLIVLGLLIASGVDRQLEAALVQASPSWLTELTTRY
jgi:cytochrome c biogenesis protein CcdA